MKDYGAQLGFYYEPETREQTEDYFARYWLSKREFNEEWLSLHRKIFEVTGPSFPHVKMRNGFDILTLRGGVIFGNEDFLALQRCMKAVGDQYFVIVEHVDDNHPHHGEPPLRFRYPADVTWKELMSGGYVSRELFRMPVKEYFVYGDSGVWGKYAADDYALPVDLIGFRHEYSELFRKNFERILKDEAFIT